MFHGICGNLSEICQYRFLWQISDRFIYLTLTVFWHSYEFWHILETFPNLIWQIYDTIPNLTDLWHLYDTFQTLFWQFFVTDSFLTDFRQISDTILKFLGPTKAKSTRLFGSRFPNSMIRACRKWSASLFPVSCLFVRRKGRKDGCVRRSGRRYSRPLAHFPLILWKMRKVVGVGRVHYYCMSLFLIHDLLLDLILW